MAPPPKSVFSASMAMAFLAQNNWIADAIQWRSRKVCYRNFVQKHSRNMHVIIKDARMHNNITTRVEIGAPSSALIFMCLCGVICSALKINTASAT